MKNIKLFIPALAAVLCGCASAPNLGPSIMQSAVAGGASLAILKDPNVKPYLQAAAPVVCDAAGSGKLDPQSVIAALESSSAKEFKTPEAVIAFNMAFAFYEAFWYSSTNTTSSAAQPYLQATCNGLTLATEGTVASGKLLALPPKNQVWPHVK